MSVLDTLIVVGLPFVLLLSNMSVRQILGLHHSAAADTLIALVIFQLVVLGDASHFRNFIADPNIKNSIYTVFIFLLIVTMLAWIILLAFAEPKILRYQHRLLFETLCKVAACTAKSRFNMQGYPAAAKMLSFFFPLALGGGTLVAFLYGR